jgi:type I restriction enzyme M protein
MPDHNDFANLIWQIVGLIHAPFRPPKYERVMLSMTMLPRFACVLARAKPAVLAECEGRKSGKLKGKTLASRLNGSAMPRTIVLPKGRWAVLITAPVTGQTNSERSV